MNKHESGRSAALHKSVRVLVAIALVVGVSGLFLALSPLEIGGGDRDEIVRMAGDPHFVFHYRAPLVVAVHQALSRTFRPLGLTPEMVVRITSAVAGGLFVLVLLQFSRHPKFWMPCLATGTVMVFWGHVETYALAYTAALWFLLQGVRFARGERASIWPAAGAWAVACGCHMANVFYLPALVWLAYGADRRSLDPIVWTVIGLGAVFLCLPFAVMPLGFDTLTLERLTPWFRATGPYHKFTLLSWAHLKLVGSFWLFGSPVALVGIVGGLLRLRSDRVWRFLLAASGCALLWTFFWNPDLGWGDWDLFGQCAVPLNLLTGWTLLHWPARRSSQGAPWPQPKCERTHLAPSPQPSPRGGGSSSPSRREGAGGGENVRRRSRFWYRPIPSMICAEWIDV